MTHMVDRILKEGHTEDPARHADFTAPSIARYGAAVLLVAVATIIALGSTPFVPAPGLTLVFVLPVVIAGAWLGWGPSVLATILGVLVFDFLFTQPFYSLRIDDPAEIWAACLLLVTAAVVGAIAWQSRQSAFEARRAAEQSAALHDLAHAVIKGEPGIVQAGAVALQRVFSAPAAVLTINAGQPVVAASSPDATLSNAELRAASDAVSEGAPLRAQTYPHETSRFDMWPVVAGSKEPFVLAVDFDRSTYERPCNADRLLEIIAAYLASRS